MAAGRRALAAGFGGPVQADERVPCGHCGRYDVGAFDRCMKAQSPAEAQLHTAQARDPGADVDRADALLSLVTAELAMGL